MTRRFLIKQTNEYIQMYILAFFCQVLVTFAIFYYVYDPTPNRPVSDSFIQASYIVPLGFIFITNYIFYYRYLYDIYKKNIYEAVIIELDLDGIKGRLDVLSRVFEGTVVGKPKKKGFLKSTRATDYVFKVRGNVLLEYGEYGNDKMRIKYLKHSKAIVEIESLVKDVHLLLEYCENSKDYILRRYPTIPILKMGEISYSLMPVEKAKQILKMGKITRVSVTLKEKIEKIFGGIVYGILATPIIYIIERIIILIFIKVFE